MSTEEIYEPENSVVNHHESSVSNNPGDALFTSENLEILNDVVMEIRVEIGRAKMKISDLLNLKKGSVIELAQAAEDPLKIFANDKQIATGLIISTNGKYSIKIM